MCSKPSVTVAFLLLVFFLVFDETGKCQRSSGSPNLALTVRKPGDKTREIPGSSWYVADLLNNGNGTETLEAIQMPGGYAGSGKFFACGLQAWSTRQHEWTSLRSTRQSEYGRNPIESIEIKPGERMEVCASLLPAQAGALGQCVRFTLRKRWSEAPSGSLVSEPFSIGEKVATRGSPCLIK
jgi:hypothetical protein